MKKMPPVIWDRKPDLKLLVEDTLIYSLLTERIVSFDGREYDVDDDEISYIHDRLEMGYVGIGMQGSRPGEEIISNTYATDQGVKTLLDRYFPEGNQPSEDKSGFNRAQAETALNAIVAGFKALGDQAIKILVNAPEGFPLFSHTGDSYPTHEAVDPIRNLSTSEKSGAVGKGEILATLLYGVNEINLGQETDIVLTRAFPGGWHVKSVKGESGGTVPWGEAAEATAAFWGSLDKTRSKEEVEIIRKHVITGPDDKPLKVPFSAKNAIQILRDAGVPESEWEAIADEVDAGMKATAASGADSQGILFSLPNKYVFQASNNVNFGQIASNGRLGVAYPEDGTFWSRMQKYGRKEGAESLVSSMGTTGQSIPQNLEDIRAQWLAVGTNEEERAEAFTSDQLKNIIKRVKSIASSDEAPPTAMPHSGKKERLFGLLNSYLTGLEVDDWIAEEEGADSDLDLASKKIAGKLLSNRVNSILRKEGYLNEEITRSDKKEIEKMIAKRLEKDRVEQKRLFKKHLAEELKSSKFQKTILEMAKDEMGRELKGKQLEGAVLEITKKVIKKLYRELSYSYNPVIDRIKL